MTTANVSGISTEYFGSIENDGSLRLWRWDDGFNGDAIDLPSPTTGIQFDDQLIPKTAYAFRQRRFKAFNESNVALNQNGEITEIDKSGTGKEIRIGLSAYGFSTDETIYWRIDPSSEINEQDFADSATGSFVIPGTGETSLYTDNGSAGFIRIKADLLTEGAEDFAIRFYTDSQYTEEVGLISGRIIDTSRTLVPSESRTGALNINGQLSRAGDISDGILNLDNNELLSYEGMFLNLGGYSGVDQLLCDLVLHYKHSISGQRFSIYLDERNLLYDVSTNSYRIEGSALNSAAASLQGLAYLASGDWEIERADIAYSDITPIDARGIAHRYRSASIESLYNWNPYEYSIEPTRETSYTGFFEETGIDLNLLNFSIVNTSEDLDLPSLDLSLDTSTQQRLSDAKISLANEANSIGFVGALTDAAGSGVQTFAFEYYNTNLEDSFSIWKESDGSLASQYEGRSLDIATAVADDSFTISVNNLSAGTWMLNYIKVNDLASNSAYYRDSPTWDSETAASFTQKTGVDLSSFLSFEVVSPPQNGGRGFIPPRSSNDDRRRGRSNSRVSRSNRSSRGDSGSSRRDRSGRSRDSISGTSRRNSGGRSRGNSRVVGSNRGSRTELRVSNLFSETRNLLQQQSLTSVANQADPIINPTFDQFGAAFLYGGVGPDAFTIPSGLSTITGYNYLEGDSLILPQGASHTLTELGADVQIDIFGYGSSLLTNTSSGELLLSFAS